MKYIAWTVVHLGYWGVMLLSAAGIGRVLLRRHSFASAVERVVFTIALGLGSVALIIFLLGLLGLMYRWLLVGLTIPWALFTLLNLIRDIKVSSLRDLQAWKKAHPFRTVAVTLALLVGVGYWACLLANTQYPPVAWDSTDEHLIVAREFLVQHGPVALPGIIEPVLPNLDHVLFAWGMALRDDIMAQMISHTFLMLIAIGLYAWGRGNVWFGVTLAAFWLGNPMVVWLGECAYVDLCMICFAFLSMYALRVFWQKRDYGWWYLAMALSGMAAGAKLPGLFFAAIGMLTGLVALVQSSLNWKSMRAANADDKRDQREPLRFAPILIGWIIALALLTPWYGFIFFHTGNPFWPAFTRFSRGVWGSPQLVQMMNNFLTHAAEPRTLRSFVMLPLNWLRRPELYSISMHPPLNPLIIAWPLAWVVAIWNREVRWWTIYALIFTLYWFVTLQDLRFWLPALPLAAVALFESLRWLLERPATTRWKSAAYILMAVFSLSCGVRYIMPILRDRSIPPVTEEEREVYLDRVSGYPAAAYINRHAKPGEVVVVVFGTWLGYHLQPETLDLFGFLQIGRFPQFQWPADEQWVRWLESRKGKWILIVHAEAGHSLTIPNQDPAVRPFWPDYELVYSQRSTWVFLHKPVPPDVPRMIDSK